MAWSIHKLCISCLVKDKQNVVVWRVVAVYGPAYEAHKLEFINELHSVYSGWSGPTIVGGDFNLIRDSSEKNTGNINQHWANLFNDWVNKFGLIEVKSAGRRFTWSNNQDVAIMATLDRIFISTC